MSVAVLEYNAGNIQSVLHALRRIGVKPLLSSDPEVLLNATHVIFPGVGQAASTMSYLRARGLDTVISSIKQPLLGICLGMQLMCQHTQEGDTDGLGIFPTRLERFSAESEIIPHMGWNSLSNLRGELFTTVAEGVFVYFAHSYFAPVSQDTSASCCHGILFSAAISRDNFFGVQFHPEKSGAVGELILRNFLKL